MSYQEHQRRRAAIRAGSGMHIAPMPGAAPVAAPMPTVTTPEQRIASLEQQLAAMQGYATKLERDIAALIAENADLRKQIDELLEAPPPAA